MVALKGDVQVCYVEENELSLKRVGRWGGGNVRGERNRERRRGRRKGVGKASPQVLLSAFAVSSPTQQKMEPERKMCSSVIKQVKGHMIH